MALPGRGGAATGCKLFGAPATACTFVALYIYIYICVYDYIYFCAAKCREDKEGEYILYIYICIYIQKYALHTLTLRAHVGHRVATVVGASRKGGWGGGERVMWMLSVVRVPALGHNVAFKLSECGFLFYVGLSAVTSRDGLLLFSVRTALSAWIRNTCWPLPRDMTSYVDKFGVSATKIDWGR